MNEEFIRAVRAMRDAQKKYFSSRTASALKLAIFWETKVDAYLNTMPPLQLPSQEKLF